VQRKAAGLSAPPYREELRWWKSGAGRPVFARVPQKEEIGKFGVRPGECNAHMADSRLSFYPCYGTLQMQALGDRQQTTIVCATPPPEQASYLKDTALTSIVIS
jgi:hypothetical protein